MIASVLRTLRVLSLQGFQDTADVVEGWGRGAFQEWPEPLQAMILELAVAHERVERGLRAAEDRARDDAARRTFTVKWDHALIGRPIGYQERLRLRGLRVADLGLSWRARHLVYGISDALALAAAPRSRLKNMPGLGSVTLNELTAALERALRGEITPVQTPEPAWGRRDPWRDCVAGRRFTPAEIATALRALSCELKVSTRARRALEKLEAPTLLDLAALPCYEMYKPWGCGRKTIREIQKAMLDVIEGGRRA